MNVKTIGTNGQITIGTKYAGQSVAIDEIEPGVWILKLGDFIPRNERWLHEPEFSRRLDEALEWDKTHKPQESDLDELERRLLDDSSSSPLE